MFYFCLASGSIFFHLHSFRELETLEIPSFNCRKDYKELHKGLQRPCPQFSFHHAVISFYYFSYTSSPPPLIPLDFQLTSRMLSVYISVIEGKYLVVKENAIPYP